jgi:23S rRNA (guanosine2251-2'-O)-methyltransferase
MTTATRVGLGFDIHPLAGDRPLVLGGIEVPAERGLSGHSDADVLSHAVADALLGALALGDLGRHFPDSDPRFAGVSSLGLLAQVVARVREAGGRVVNVDATVVAEAPRLAPHLDRMRARLAQTLGVAEGRERQGQARGAAGGPRAAGGHRRHGGGARRGPGVSLPEPRTDGPMILHGRHPVIEALRAGPRRVDEVLFARDVRHAGEVAALAREAGIRCVAAPRSALTALAGTPHHQGVVARLAARAYAPLEEILAVPAVRREPAWFLVLDQVQDPGNVGNLLRSAAALGVHGAVLPRHQAAGLTGHAVRAAAGALEHLGVSRVANLAQALDILKREGCWVVGATASDPAARPPWELDLRGAVAIVLGSEGRGIRPLVSRSCDALTRIPLNGPLGSLNVAAAGAALLYEVARQRAAARGIPARPVPLSGRVPHGAPGQEKSG